MKFYLNSYRIGDYGAKFAELVGGGRLAYIVNVLDYVSTADQSNSREKNMSDLKQLGIESEVLDLRDFFSDNSKLTDELNRFSGVWINGGNTFVLRHAMKLSGFDKAIRELRQTQFLYAGFSAGICVVAPNLRGLQIVDKPYIFPYPQQKEVIWEGLNFTNYLILPHYKSDHPESADIDKEVEFCKANNIPYRTLRDGEVLYGENIEILKLDVPRKI